MPESKDIKHENRVADKVVERLESFERKFTSRMSVLVVSAFGLVAALTWNEAIKELINYFAPEQEIVLIYKLVAAALVTIFAVIITVILSSSDSKPAELKVTLN